MCNFYVLLLAFVLQTSGTIQGVVRDPTGAVILDAALTIRSDITGTIRTIGTDTQGRYRATGLSSGPFSLQVTAQGFAPASWIGDIRSDVPITHDFTLSIRQIAEQITVEREPLLEVSSSSTHHDFDSELLNRMPYTPPNRSMSAIVKLLPGVVEEENGRIHIRGSEAQPQYVLDGVPIADNLSGIFGTELDPENLRSAQVITGNIPAQFGDKSNAIVNVSTKSGLNSPWTGKLLLSNGSFSTGQAGIALGGHVGRLGIFTAGDVSHSRRFLDPPDMTPELEDARTDREDIEDQSVHNSGGLAHYFLRFDWLHSDRDSLRLTLSANGTNFQVPNSEESQEAGQDQRQELRDDFQSLAWTHAIGAKTIFDVALSRRSSVARLADPRKTGFPFYIDQQRRQRAEGLTTKLSREWRLGYLQAGGEGYRYPIRERFRLALTDTGDWEDAEGPIGQYTIQSPFVFDERRTGVRSAAYVQNRFRFFDRLSADFGIRFDHYKIVHKDSAITPRIGLAYYLQRTKTVFRGAYNRLFQTPPLENLLLSSTEAPRVLLPRDSPNISRVVLPERQNYYEFGVQQQLHRHFRIDAVRYFKDIRNFSDEQQLLTTGIVFPVSVARSSIRGTEVRLDMIDVRGFSAYASYANMRATITTPITGGLFLNSDDGDTEDAQLAIPGLTLPADQDERNELQFGTTYTHRSGTWLTFGGRFDSGLPTGFEDNEYSTFGSEIQAQLDPVRKRTKPRTILNVIAGISLLRGSGHPISVQAGINNLLDRFYLYNFRSVFSGTHVGRPRELMARIVFEWKNQN